MNVREKLKEIEKADEEIKNKKREREDEKERKQKLKREINETGPKKIRFNEVEYTIENIEKHLNFLRKTLEDVEWYKVAKSKEVKSKLEER